MRARPGRRPRAPTARRLAPRPSRATRTRAATAPGRLPLGDPVARAPPFLEEYAQKRSVPDEVALPEPSRLMGKTPRPFRPGPLHPDRGTGTDPSGKIQAGAATQGDRGVELLPVSVHPELLLRGAEPHEEQRRMRRVDDPHGRLGGGALGREEIRRRVRPGHPEPGKA